MEKLFQANNTIDPAETVSPKEEVDLWKKEMGTEDITDPNPEALNNDLKAKTTEARVETPAQNGITTQTSRQQMQLTSTMHHKQVAVSVHQLSEPNARFQTNH